MGIRLFNTMTRKKEDLKVLEPPKLNLFVCGPTVYDYSHLGHAKTYTQFDFIAKYLTFRGYDVFYLQNITNIDDKIIRRSLEQGVPATELAQKYEAFYHEDMEALGNTSVSEHARAHDFIDQIVDQIQRLVEKGYAYEIEGDGYYFDINAFGDYGKLSGRCNVQPGDSLCRVDENPNKRNQGDFCLWKLRKPDEPFWTTSLGEGRPGWHIEDTAITEHYFGPQYDIHGGAVDLIFPHHEAEIAQIEAVSGCQPMVQHWLHTGFLNTPDGEKMSKSLGNFQTIRESLKHFDPKSLRFFFLTKHYRSSQELTKEGLDQAVSGYERIRNFVRLIDESHDDQDNESLVEAFRERLLATLDDDFDSPNAITQLFDFIKEQNRLGKPGRRVAGLLKEINAFFGFIAFEDSFVPDEEIQAKIDLRNEYRKQKRWKEADEIRDFLKEQNIILEDTPEGVRWHRNS